MTFFHFVNCVLLTFTPYYISYKATRLGEFRAMTTCIWGGLAYVATQLAKMLILATFVPLGEPSTTSFDFTQEIIRSIFNLADILGIHLVLNSLGSSYEPEIKILGVGVGWAFADSLLLRLPQYWFGARTLEFDWTYIQSGLEGNIYLISTLAFTTVVYFWGRRKLDKKFAPAVFGIMIANTVVPSVLNYLKFVLDNTWIVLIIGAGIAVAEGLAAKVLLNISSQHKK